MNRDFNPRNDFSLEYIANSWRRKWISGSNLARLSRADRKEQSYAEEVQGTLFDTPELRRTIEDIYRHPLRQAAKDVLNRQLRSGIADETLAQLVIALRGEDRLCIVHEEGQSQELRIMLEKEGMAGKSMRSQLEAIPKIQNGWMLTGITKALEQHRKKQE